jgi:hypothetical protein
MAGPLEFKPPLMMDVRVLGRVAVRLTETLASKGVTMERSFDPYAFREAALEAGRIPSALFDPDRFAFASGGMFWIAGRRDGRIVHLQAVRLDDTEGGTLASYLPALFRQGWRASPPIVECPLLDRISGRVAYRGDFWTEAKNGLIGLAAPLARLGTLYTFTTWHRAPDWAWAVFERRPFEQGFPARSWFHETAPIGQGWEDWLQPDERVGALSYADFIRQLALADASPDIEP